ncbi:MAG: PA14 domain-containing protein, partial [Bacteriovoracia bacterium]
NTFVSQNASGNGAWNTGVAHLISRNAEGYPLVAPATVSGQAEGQVLATIIYGDLAGKYPGGTYVVKYDGAGTLQFGGDATITVQQTGRLELSVTPGNTGIIMRIVASTSGNPVRNIRIFHKSFEGANGEPNGIFHPALLQKLAPFSTIRMMDWQRTNNSPLVAWGDRRLPEYYTQTDEKGVALEHQIDLANALGKNIWLNIPHKADDGYVQSMATVVKNRLNPALKAYIEYSNEVWNGGFQQHQYAEQQGDSIYGNPTAYNFWKYYALRSVQVLQIFKNVFGGQSQRIVRVIGSQHDWGGGGMSQQILAHAYSVAQNPADFADALATAPYFGSSYGLSCNPANLNVDTLMAGLQNDIATLQKPRSLANKGFADQYGLDFIAYEAGQHLVRVANCGTANAAIDAFFIAANRSPLLKNVYLYDLQNLEGIYDLVMEYSFIGKYGSWGSWGILENMTQTRAQAPKYDAILTYLEGSSPPSDTVPPTITVSPTSVTIAVGASYTLANAMNGVSAIDNVDGNITAQVSVSGAAFPLNTASPGTLTLTYAVSDAAGNAAAPKSRTVTIQAATPPPPPPPGGNGLKGEYFEGANNFALRDRVLVRTDAAVNFNWDYGAPATSVSEDTFSVRWTGYVKPKYSEAYTFCVESDDGALLRVDGALLVNALTDHAATEICGPPISLQANQLYTIKLKYYENLGQASVKLRWKSASQTKEIVPSSRLFLPDFTCQGDLDGNGMVDSMDLAILMSAWGVASSGAMADFDQSGMIDSWDLAILLMAWGACSN